MLRLLLLADYRHLSQKWPWNLQSARNFILFKKKSICRPMNKSEKAHILWGFLFFVILNSNITLLLKLFIISANIWSAFCFAFTQLCTT